MIPVYFCTMDGKDTVRTAMSILSQERWQQEKGIRFRRISPSSIECKPEEFQRSRRVYAEAVADSSIYVVADDDCMLYAEKPVETMLGLMDKHPDFAILSMFPFNCQIHPWTPDNGYVPVLSHDIMEHYSVGGIRFCRKGALTEFPPQTGKGYDGDQCGAIRANGGLVGYARNVFMNHLGEGASTVWR